MPRLTVSMKLGIAIGTQLLLLVAIAITSYWRARHVENELRAVVEIDGPLSDSAFKLEINTLGSGFAVLSYLHDGNPEHLDRMKEEFDDFQAAFRKLDELSQTAQQQQQLTLLKQLFREYQSHAFKLLADGETRSLRLGEFQEINAEIVSQLSDRSQMSETTDVAQSVARQNATSELSFHVNEVARWLQQFLALHLAEAERRIDDNEQGFGRILATYRASELSAAESTAADELEQKFDRTIRLARGIIGLEKSRAREISALISTRERMDSLLANGIQRELYDALQLHRSSVQQTASTARTVTMAVMIAALIVGGGGGLLVARGLRHSVRSLVEGADAIGRGSMDHRVDVRTNDEMHDIAEAFNRMVGDVQLAHAGLQRANSDLERRVARRTAELSQRNEELQQFAYVASHDLQEPLRKVASCCQVLAEDYGGQLDDEARQWIGYAVTGSKQMQSLVADLLTYSRLGRKGQRRERVEAQAACQAAVGNLQMAIEESGAEISYHRLPAVKADESQLVQLFQNLIGNAIKYRGDAPPKIEIGIQQHRPPEKNVHSENKPGVSLRFEERDERGAVPLHQVHQRGGGRNRHTFYVRDNGIGIQPEYFERIFVIFQRLHRKDEYSGTGIGLSICKKIVLQHGGEMWVESTPGEGSTFYFTLPKAKQDDTLVTAGASPNSEEEK